jgi:hypothetical protein
VNLRAVRFTETFVFVYQAAQRPNQRIVIPVFMISRSGKCHPLGFSDSLVTALKRKKLWLWRMSSSLMWHGGYLVRTDVSEERVASIFRVVGLALIAAEEPPTLHLCPPSHPNVLIQCSFELKFSQTSNTFPLAYFLYPEDGGDISLRNAGSIRPTRRHIPENGILRKTKCFIRPPCCNFMFFFFLRYVRTELLRVSKIC